MRTAQPVITVSIRHGNLTYARHPVLVGHYQGDTVVSAEAALDRQMKGHLTRGRDLGIYPGRRQPQRFLNDSLAAADGRHRRRPGRNRQPEPGSLNSIRDALLDMPKGRLLAG